jgi:putative holliday junction resolvase
MRILQMQFSSRPCCDNLLDMTEQISEPDAVPSVPMTGVLLGIDYGTKRVGVAVSDRDQRFSSPLHNHERHGLHVDERFFRKVVDEYGPVGLVVGLPIHLSGDESEKSKEARLFAKWLTGVTGLPHTFQDERFSSFYAQKLLMAAEMSAKKRKQRMDKLAAQILLQAFLDARIAAVAKAAQTVE